MEEEDGSDFAPHRFDLTTYVDKTVVGEEGGEEVSVERMIANVDAALEGLVKEMEQTDARIVELETKMMRHGSSFHAAIAQTQADFGSSSDAFQALDVSIDAVGSSAVRIGNHLARLDTQRRRAKRAAELLGYLEALGAGEEEDVEMDAHIVATLTKVVSDTDAPELEALQPVVEARDVAVQEELLASFRDAYQEGNVGQMRVAADAFAAFESPERMAHELEECFYVKRIAGLDIDAWVAAPLPQAVATIHRSVVRILAREAEVVEAVFPGWSARVLARLVRYILSKVVLKAYRRILELPPPRGANTTPALWSLHSLYAVYTASTELLSALAEFSLGDAVSSLEDVMAEFFSPLRAGYLEKERYAVSEFTQALIKAEHLAVGISDTPAPGGGKGKRSFFASLTGLGGSGSGGGADDDGGEGGEEEEVKAKVSVRVASEVLEVFEEAVKRATRLSLPEVVADNVQQLFVLLLYHLGKKYLRVSVEAAVKELPDAHDVGNEPRLQVFFVVISRVNRVLEALQAHFATFVLPVIRGAVNVTTICVERKTQTLQMLERSVNGGMTKALIVLVSHFHDALSARQEPGEFAPKEDDDAAMMLTAVKTGACQAGTAFLDRVRRMLLETLDDPANASRVLRELGFGVIEVLLRHMKRFRYSQFGALRLLNDLQAYQSTLAEFGVGEVNDSFGILRELGNLFLVAPQNLAGVAGEGHLSGVDGKVLKEYISLRTDWKDVNGSGVLKGL